MLTGSPDTNDRLVGGAGNDTLLGLTGDDLPLGGSGDDSISGDDGIDGCWAATDAGDHQDGTCENTDL